MSLPDKAQTLIGELDKRNINPFVSLAKLGLCVAAFLCCFVLMLCSMLVVLNSRLDQIPNIVGAAQALVVICLSVMAWHGYKGSQALYLIRHWGSGPQPPEQEP